MLNRRTGVLRLESPPLCLHPNESFSKLQEYLPDSLMLSWELPEWQLYGVDGVRICDYCCSMMLGIRKNRLRSIYLRLILPEATTEHQRHIQHCEALKQWLRSNPPYRYYWGIVTVHFDRERGGSEIHIAYDDR
ncbi:MAG: hypothetical protein Tsb002_37970 [Wenzhouxiangellaceae bacterium]